MAPGSVRVTPASSNLVSVPGQINLFGPLPITGWRMRQPLPLQILREDDGRFVLVDRVFDVYGIGESVDAAESDFASTLVEFYELMEASPLPESRDVVVHLTTYLERD